MSRGAGIPKATGFRARYEEISNQFWRLQQVEETEEEAEYAKLCRELESMLTAYRDELEALERENLEQRGQVEGLSGIKAQYQALRNEEAYLIQLKNDLDDAARR